MRRAHILARVVVIFAAVCAGIGAIVGGLVLASATRSAQPTWAPNGKRTLTFDDEFNRTTVDTRKWELGWYLGQGKAGYSPPVNSSEIACYYSGNVTESGGYLNLALRRSASRCDGHSEPWTGALVDTRNTFHQYGGSVEARVCTHGNSHRQIEGWPAFWTNGPDSVPWPNHGEIDDVEGLAGSPAAHLHYVDKSRHQQDPGWSPASVEVGCHDYGETWDTATSTVTFYWDGSRVWSHQFDVAGRYPQDLILEYTIEGVSATPPNSSTIKIDWVRAWSS